MKNTILIVTQPGDYHAEALSAILHKKHRLRSRYLYMRDYPSKANASFYCSTASEQTFTYNSQHESLECDSIRSIWWRRPEPCVVPTQNNLIDWDFAQTECNHFLQGALWSLDCLWINDPVRNRFAARKPVQLAKASTLGISIPETLITNSAEEAATFIDNLKGQVIFKRVGTSPGPLSKTCLVTQDTVERLDAITHSPAIFQQYIDAKGDLRVIYIDGELYTTFIDSQKGTTPEDCRFDHSVDYSPHVLPTSVAEAISQLMTDFGLVYGAIDLRLGKNGEYYFLEVNPSGQFAYLEIKTGLPITEKLASVLAEGKSSETPTCEQYHGPLRSTELIA